MESGIDARIDNERARTQSGDIDLEPITSEDEDYESSPPEYQISTFPADYTLEVLYMKWRAKEILIPDFQRGFVWKQVQSSKLIESFLVGLPVPAVFLYTERKSQKYFVIDGQQRLKSIFYFFEGYFGTPEDDKRKVFKLVGLSEKSRFNAKTYEDLDPEDQLRLKNCVLRSFVVQQLDPSDDTSMYHIFERLNTGGTLLTNQEVRNSVYHGNLIAFLNEINEYGAWRNILGKPTPDSRKKDIELLVRFFAMRDIEAYEKPMKEFLSKYMRKNRDASDESIKTAGDLFRQTCDKVSSMLGDKPFHIRNGLNAAVFDAVMTTISKNISSLPTDLKDRYKLLLANADFDRATRESTTDNERVKLRLRKTAEILFE
ncbi:MAG TPA: DUF262 domain-containing protein [Desulfomonilia bacterium]